MHLCYASIITVNHLSLEECTQLTNISDNDIHSFGDLGDNLKQLAVTSSTPNASYGYRMRQTTLAPSRTKTQCSSKNLFLCLQSKPVNKINCKMYVHKIHPIACCRDLLQCHNIPPDFYYIIIIRGLVQSPCGKIDVNILPPSPPSLNVIA